MPPRKTRATQSRSAAASNKRAPTPAAPTQTQTKSPAPPAGRGTFKFKTRADLSKLPNDMLINIANHYGVTDKTSPKDILDALFETRSKMRVAESLLDATSHEPVQDATSNAAPAPAHAVEADPAPVPVPVKTTTRGRKRAISPPAEMPPLKRSSRTRKATSRVAVEADANVDEPVPPVAEHTPTIEAPPKPTRGRKPSARQAAAAKNVSTTRKTSRAKNATPLVEPEPEDTAEAEIDVDEPAAAVAEHTTTTAPTTDAPTKSTTRTRKPSARQAAAAKDVSTSRKTSRAKKTAPVVEPEPEPEEADVEPTEAPDVEATSKDEPTTGRSSRSRGRPRKMPSPVMLPEKAPVVKVAASTGRASKRSISKTTSAVEVAGPSEVAVVATKSTARGRKRAADAITQDTVQIQDVPEPASSTAHISKKRRGRSVSVTPAPAADTIVKPTAAKRSAKGKGKAKAVDPPVEEEEDQALESNTEDPAPERELQEEEAPAKPVGRSRQRAGKATAVVEALTQVSPEPTSPVVQASKTRRGRSASVAPSEPTAIPNAAAKQNAKDKGKDKALESPVEEEEIEALVSIADKRVVDDEEVAEEEAPVIPKSAKGKEKAVDPVAITIHSTQVGAGSKEKVKKSLLAERLDLRPAAVIHTAMFARAPQEQSYYSSLQPPIKYAKTTQQKDDEEEESEESEEDDEPEQEEEEEEEVPEEEENEGGNATEPEGKSNNDVQPPIEKPSAFRRLSALFGFSSGSASTTKEQAQPSIDTGSEQRRKEESRPTPTPSAAPPPKLPPPTQFLTPLPPTMPSSKQKQKQAALKQFGPPLPPAMEQARRQSLPQPQSQPQSGEDDGGQALMQSLLGNPTEDLPSEERERRLRPVLDGIVKSMFAARTKAMYEPPDTPPRAGGSSARDSEVEAMKEWREERIKSFEKEWEGDNDFEGMEPEVRRAYTKERKMEEEKAWREKADMEYKFAMSVMKGVADLETQKKDTRGNTEEESAEEGGSGADEEEEDEDMDVDNLWKPQFRPGVLGKSKFWDMS